MGSILYHLRGPWLPYLEYSLPTKGYFAQNPCSSIPAVVLGQQHSQIELWIQAASRTFVLPGFDNQLTVLVKQKTELTY